MNFGVAQTNNITERFPKPNQINVTKWTEF